MNKLIQAQKLYLKGQIKQAYSLYLQALNQYPDQAEILYKLGLIALESTQLPLANSWFKKALKLRPDDPQLYFISGRIEQELKQFHLAQKHYEHALRLEPDFDEVQLQLGIVYVQLKEYPKALITYQKILKKNPESAGIYYNIGLVQDRLKQFSSAQDSFQKAIHISPAYEEPYLALFELYLKQAQYQLALKLSDTISSFKLKVTQIKLLLHLGIQTGRTHLIYQSIDLYKAELKHSPESQECYQFLGLAYYELILFGEARKYFLKWLGLNNESLKARFFLASIERDMGNNARALTYFQEALSLRKPTPWNRKSDDIHTLSQYIFALRASDKIDEATLLYRTKELERKYLPQKPPSSYPIHISANRPLKVGYISQDFKSFSSTLFISTLFKYHHPEVVELHVFCDVERPDGQTEYLKSLVTHWHPIAHLKDEAVASLIRQTQVDILVELTTPCYYWKVMSLRAAPIQITGFCYTASSSKFYDYRLTDRHLTPSSQVSFNSEKLLYLNYLLCWSPPKIDIKVSPLPALKNKHLTFGCGNYWYKVSDSTLELWAQILKKIPTATLYLKNPSFNDPFIRQLTQKKFLNFGILPQRLQFKGLTTPEEHLAFYQDIDIALDPFPVSGGLSTFEALWMGVPVLTLAKGTRMGVSILHAANLREWIAQSEAQYLDIAISHTNQLPTLAKLRQNLRASIKNSPLCSAETYINNLEEAYLTIARNSLYKQS